MRIRLSKQDLDKLFSAVLSNKGYRSRDLARINNVSERTIRDWKRGVSTIPEQAYTLFISLSQLDKELFQPQVLGDYWHIKEAASKGGHVRMKIYGDLGTQEGRRKGGLASIKTHIREHTGFKVLRTIEEPDRSEYLAELIGILIGDGHLSAFQVSMTTNSRTDMEHAIFVQKLFKRLFKLSAKVTARKYENAVNVVVSSKGLVNYLNKCGMPVGNKIKNGLAVPPWIYSNLNYQKAFIRGLFDTDGCIYLDRHLIRGKLYQHLGWTITSYASALVEGIIKILVNLDFKPTFRPSQKSVFLRRGRDIKRYFSLIGTHNPKHFNRFQSFMGISK